MTYSSKLIKYEVKWANVHWTCFSLATVCIQGIQLGASAEIVKRSGGSSEQEVETLQPVDNALTRCLSFGK